MGQYGGAHENHNISMLKKIIFSILVDFERLE
jgi:hypothetical protein